jgi:hypothetical protein
VAGRCGLWTRVPVYGSGGPAGLGLGSARDGPVLQTRYELSTCQGPAKLVDLCESETLPEITRQSSCRHGNHSLAEIVQGFDLIKAWNYIVLNN